MKLSLFTRVLIKIPKKHKVKAISAIISSNLKCPRTFIDSEGNMTFFVAKRSLNQYKNVFIYENIEYSETKIRGLFSFLEEVKSRYGVILGILLLFLVTYLSSNIVWKINIIGNDKISDEQIIEELKEADFHLGTFVPKVNYKTLHNKFLLNSKDISWISVNITGNVANVHVRETKKESISQNKEYTNIVASHDGQIASIIVIEGEKKVSIGDVVREGDILISGVIDSQAVGTRYEHAQGEIKAYVSKEIYIEVPYKNEEKTYYCEPTKENIYKIFNFKIKNNRNYGNSTEFYDTISKKSYLTFFGLFQLPIEKETVIYYPYKFVSRELTVDEAVDLAFSKLRTEMDEKLENAELISKKVETSYDDNAFYISCKLYCLENIAISQPFFVEN